MKDATLYRQDRPDRWLGFRSINDGKPADEAFHKTCFSCHEPAKERDFFTRYVP